MTTYVYMKMSDMTDWCGNPFDKLSISKNIRYAICRKHYKRVDFELIDNDLNSHIHEQFTVSDKKFKPSKMQVIFNDSAESNNRLDVVKKDNSRMLVRK